MRRSLFFCALAFLAGIYIGYFAPDIIPVPWLFLVALVLFVSLFFKKRSLLPFCMVLLFFMGALYLQNADDITKRPLYPYLDEYVTVSAEVMEEPVYNENNDSHTVMARLKKVSFLKEEKAITEIVQIKINAGDRVPQFGESFTSVCRFYVPQEAMNRGGFDYGLFLRTKKVFFRATAEPGTVCVTGKFPLSAFERIYAFNRQCFKNLNQIFPQEAASIFEGMCLGEKTSMPETLENQLQVSGLSHMTSVSGMHVTILMSALFVLLNLFQLNRHKSIWFIIGMILLFMLFAGTSPSVVRAAVMGVFMLVGYGFLRHADALTSLGAAAGVIVLHNPFSAFDVGFILSFGAMLGILIFTGPIQNFLVKLCKLDGLENFGARIFKSLLSILSISFGVQIFVLPLNSWIFGYISLWSVLTSILAAPLMPVILMGGLLVCFLGFLHPVVACLPACFVYPFVKLFLMIVKVFGGLQCGVLTVGSFSLFGLYFYGLLLFVLYCLLHKQFYRCLAPVIALPVLISLYITFAFVGNQTAAITFINVGQGDCTLLELPNGVDILIDGGGTPAYLGDYDVGENIVLPYLRKKGIKKLDYMIASHPHEDHLLGLTSLLDFIPVDRVLVPPGFEQATLGAEFLEKAVSAGASVTSFAAGDAITFSSTCQLVALMPGDEWAREVEVENDASLVLWFQFYDTTALFAGDIETEGEGHLISTEPPKGGAQIVKVAHHGSETSTSEEFLRWATPHYAYIPCGQNSFGHPHASVLERLTAHGVTVYRADQDKDVTFILGRNGIQSIKRGRSNYDED